VLSSAAWRSESYAEGCEANTSAEGGAEVVPKFPFFPNLIFNQPAPQKRAAVGSCSNTAWQGSIYDELFYRPYRHRSWAGWGQQGRTGGGMLCSGPSTTFKSSVAYIWQLLHHVSASPRQKANHTKDKPTYRRRNLVVYCSFRALSNASSPSRLMTGSSWHAFASYLGGVCAECPDFQRRSGAWTPPSSPWRLV